jgi:hypothetical protein
MPTYKIGTLVDRYDVADLAVKLAEAELSAAKKKKTIASDALMDGFKKQDLDGARGTKRGALLSLVKLTNATITNRAKLDAYIKRKNANDLMQSRINKQAWLDRMEADGKPIPGVESFERVTLRITRSR